MKSKLLNARKFIVSSRSDEQIVVSMDLYQIQGKRKILYPDGYRFSWIAFVAQTPSRRVLFDCHPPKGFHFHIDDHKTGISLEWVSLEDAENLFFRTVARHFNIDPKELQ